MNPVNGFVQDENDTTHHDDINNEPVPSSENIQEPLENTGEKNPALKYGHFHSNKGVIRYGLLKRMLVQKLCFLELTWI